jgi:hypothetical protein
VTIFVKKRDSLRSLTRKSVTEYFSKDRRIFDGRLIILKRVISKAASLVGVPLYMAATGEKLAFARCF